VVSGAVIATKKHEARNPKSETNSNLKIENGAARRLAISNFEIPPLALLRGVSDLVLSASCLL
jgi:hypothetical protein